MNGLGKAALSFTRLGALLALLATPAFAQVPANVRCDRCHADQEFLVGKADTPAEEAALFVPGSLFLGTSHDTVACVDCHVDYGESYPHGVEVQSVTCESCHEAEGVDWAMSTHATAIEDPEDAPDCMECHGIHEVFGTGHRQSPSHPLNAVALCADCHADSAIVANYFDEPADSLARTAVEHFWEGRHGLGFTAAGLVSSATCADCHHPHRVLAADSVGSTLHPDSVGTTCGACHLGVQETHDISAHGVAFLEGTETEDGNPGPTCLDCHAGHEIETAREDPWRRRVVDECGTCHESLYDSYRNTYHGKVAQLGYGRTAKCADCHTAHDSRATDDTLSSVHPMNLVATCGECHSRVSERFVEYYSHGDFTNREDYPRLYWPWVFMTALLVGVFGFFGTHSILWLTRTWIERLRPAAEPPEGEQA